jgi:hypothetical protein
MVTVAAVTGRTFEYGIDAGDRLVWVDGAWRRFATENSAADLPERAVGRPLWDSIAGTEVREIYKAIFARVRQQRTVEFPFRCDAPDLLRFMRMRITPEEEGAIRFLTWIEREEVRSRVAFFEPATPRTAEMLLVCAWCKRVKAGDWHDVEAAIQRLRLFDEPLLPQISHGICERCERIVNAAF